MSFLRLEFLLCEQKANRNRIESRNVWLTSHPMRFSKIDCIQLISLRGMLRDNGSASALARSTLNADAHERGECYCKCIVSMPVTLRWFSRFFFFSPEPERCTACGAVCGPYECYGQQMNDKHEFYEFFMKVQERIYKILVGIYSNGKLNVNAQAI